MTTATNSELSQIYQTKPLIYPYIRLIWAAFISMPGMLFVLLLGFNKLNLKPYLDLIIIIISFGIGLSSSVSLERYLLFLHPLLAMISISVYLKLTTLMKNSFKQS